MTEPPWELRRGSSVCSVSSDATYRPCPTFLPAAGSKSARLNRAGVIGEGNTVSNSGRVDLSLLQMSEGPHASDGPKQLMGFNTRVDPGVFAGGAGLTSERVTYSMVTKDDWDFEKNQRQKARAKSMDALGGVKTRKSAREERDEERNPCVISLRPQVKGRGECPIDGKTDPITHFRHEGIVFKDPWLPGKRTNYDHRAAEQSWTWQAANDDGARRNRSITGNKNRQILDCRGVMHYLNAGEEDMIPAATNTYIKSDMMPSKDHITLNDKKCLKWCERYNPSPRTAADKYFSNRIWDCMIYDYQQRPEVVNASAQCSLRSESEHATPRRSSRGVLTSVQSEPQIARAPREAWMDGSSAASREHSREPARQLSREPARARDDSPLRSSPPWAENVPPASSLQSSLGSISEKKPVRRKKPIPQPRSQIFRSFDTPSSGCRTPQSGARTPPLRRAMSQGSVSGRSTPCSDAWR